MAPSAWKVGDLVYIPSVEKDTDVAFHPGTILEIPRGSTEAAVQLLSQSDTRVVAQSALRRRFERGDDSTSQDNTSLVHLNDATILENLEARHKKDEIYTYTASVLLAMNPYRDIDGLYGEEMCAAYRGKHIGALAPHPYAIADTAFRALVRDRKNQGFIISGESGAGKTETAKIVMQYLGFVSGTSSDLASEIQKRVVQAQPILESFGNAVTMRNNNSSRFGKYNRIYFDDKGTLVDASVTTYLLESSRVVVHSGRERTYHCFYEMLSGLKPEQLASLHLEPDQRYRLLASESDVPQKEEEQWMKQFKDRDVKNFDRLCEAFTVVGLSKEDIDNCFRVLAGLIHLGDLAGADCKEEDGEVDTGSTVELNEQSLAWAAELLGMDADELGGALKRRKVCVPGRNSFHEAPRTPAQFRHALHSLIKALYKRIFERTVQRINVSFQELSGGAQGAEGGDVRHIGILDIYGFERLQRNSFEQLCINLANERLQQYFVENVLVAEQALYEREGLPWIGLTLPDSTPVVSAIGNIFETLDDFSQRQAKGIAQTTDERFCRETVQDATKDSVRKEVLKQVKMSNKRGTGECLGMDEGFVIKHYAGEVVYNTKGWLDKNNDCLLQECESLICNSSFDFVASLGEEDNIKGKVPFRSISKKYTADLKNLLDTLSTCQLHYIRCFKPNAFQKPHIFNQNLVLDQIIQCGTIELVKIMHDGYPNRCLFEDMVNRFRDMLPQSFQRYGLRTFIEALMLAYEVPKDEWALGMSRLFLKAGQLKALEDMRSEGAAPDPEKLKEIVSSIIRKKWIRAKNAVQVCNFVPKFLQEVYATKAAKALCMQALVMAKLQPKLLAARQRVQQRRLMARRRIKAAFFTARLAKALMGEARAKRKARLQKAMHLYWTLQTRLRPAVQGARARAAEAELRREAERRREQERMAAEQAEAMRKIEEDRLKMQAELAEQKAALEEQQKQDEEKKRQDEQTRLDSIAAKERELAEQQRRLEEERKQMEEEKVGQGRQSILAGATPQGNRIKGRGGDQDECETGEADDVDAADSASAHDHNPQMQQMMDERIKELEKEMQRKQNEIMEQMQALQARNAELEKKFEQGQEPLASPSPGRDCHSPLPMDSPGQDHDAPTTPPSGARQSLPSATRSARRYSLISVNGETSASASRQSLKGGKRRQSVAQEALQLEASAQPLGDAAGRQEGPQAVQFQRKWWAEQRQFLLEDLFPGGQSPTKPSPGTGRSHRRASIGGGNDSSVLADQSRRERRATQPIQSVMEPEVEQQPKANLAGRFDSEALEQASQAAFQPPPRSARDSTGSRLKKPEFHWNQGAKRQSVSKPSAER